MKFYAFFIIHYKLSRCRNMSKMCLKYTHIFLLFYFCKLPIFIVLYFVTSDIKMINGEYKLPSALDLMRGKNQSFLPEIPEMSEFMLHTEKIFSVHLGAKNSSVRDHFQKEKDDKGRRYFNAQVYKKYYADRQRFRIQMCHVISSTYVGALTALRRYYPLRYFYVDNFEYEVGYIVNEIVENYQNLLELYYLVVKRFHNMGTMSGHGPLAYVLFMYTNMLEVSKMIIHYCNMLHELEKKYEWAKRTHFDDYHKIFQEVVKGDWEKYIKNYQKQLKEAEQERKRKRKKEIKEQLMLGVTPRTDWKKFWNTKKSRHHDLHYGWSIEDW